MIRPHPTPELPVLHRVTIGYLMLPVGIWLLGWFHWWLGIPTTALLVVGFWKTLGGLWRVTPRPATVVMLLMALGWVLMTAAGGLFDINNWDWIKHRAILTDLARYAWPVHLPNPLAAFLSPDTLLRYYLGYYMVPGLAGRWFGPAALNWVVPLWTWGGRRAARAAVHAPLRPNRGGHRRRSSPDGLQRHGLPAHPAAVRRSATTDQQIAHRDR